MIFPDLYKRFISKKTQIAQIYSNKKPILIQYVKERTKWKMENSLLYLVIKSNFLI